MTVTQIKKILFPEGNFWIYPLVIIWFAAIAIFQITLPAMLVSTYYWYEHETGISVGMDNQLIELSSALFNVCLISLKYSMIFFVISAISDAYEYYKQKYEERGDL